MAGRRTRGIETSRPRKNSKSRVESTVEESLRKGLIGGLDLIDRGEVGERT